MFEALGSDDLPLFNKGFRVIRTPETIANFLNKGLPEGYQQLVSSYAKTSPPDYIGQISDNWNSSSSLKYQKPSSKTIDDTEIQLVLVDDTNGGQCYSCNIGLSSTLKTLFNSYAEQRGTSLRSLRFSHKSKTLFLSSVGKKTPDELNIQNQDRIHVRDSSIPEEPNCSSSNQVNTLSAQMKGKSQNCPRKANSRRKKAPVKRQQSVKTLEECKAQHSKMLTKLHEEVQPQLKQIRNYLNLFDLERKPPKLKVKSTRKNKKSKAVVVNDILPNLGIGGKAGKPYFMVQVGDVENLYNTKKHCRLHHSVADTMIDLHGYTKNEALNTLDENLLGWVKSTMEGNYPWVIQYQ